MLKVNGTRLLLGVAGAWAAVLLAWPAAPDAMLVDDAWYYLRTAQNVVQGYGISFDRLEPFNGFHPLWLAVLVPPATLPLGPDGFARLVLLLQLVLTVVGVLQWQRALRTELAGAAALLLLNPWVAKILLCGQESALAFALTGALGAGLREQRSAARLGLLAGLAVLARLDAAPWVALLLVAGLWPRRAALGGAVALALTTLLPWAIWSFWTFDTVVPVSAAIKAEFAARATRGAWLLGLVAGSVVGGGSAWRLRERSPLALAVVAGATLEATRLVALRTTNGLSIWYWWPLLPTVMALAATAPARLRVIGAGSLLATALATWVVRLDPASYAVATASREAGVWLREHTAPTAVIAGWDIGAVAAWSDRPFRNLEGLAASWRFKREVLDTGQLLQLIQSGTVEYVTQHFNNGPLEPQLRRLGLDPTQSIPCWSREVEMRSITERSHLWRSRLVVLSLTPPKQH